MLDSPNQRKLQQFELDKLNKDLQNYKNLTSQIQANVRRVVLQQIKNQRNQFKARLTESLAELKNLNLILGATGAGKSTLFNYLNYLPLIIKEGTDKNGKKNQTIRLDVDQSKIAQGTKIAPIGHGFVSETTIPNFSKSKHSDVTYVDCAGQFDSRDILQSIINSYFKFQLATQSKQVKLTIAINYHDIRANRGTIFKQILKQVGNFIGLWEEFQKNRSISLVITGADPDVKDVRNQVIQMIKEISQVVKDLGPFKEILGDIAQREAIAIFLAPKKKSRKIPNQDGEEEEDQFYIPDGDMYKPNSKVCSAQIISKILQETKFMPSQPGLFVHNLQNNAQLIVNALCEGIINEIKKEVMSIIVLNSFCKTQDPKSIKMKELTKNQMNAQKALIQQKIEKLTDVKNIEDIIKIFEIKDQLLFKYHSLTKDLHQFLAISNIPNIQEKIAQVSKDIKLFLSEKTMKIDQSTIELINKDYQQSLLQKQKLEQQLKSKKYQIDAKVKMQQINAKKQIQIQEKQLQAKKIEAQQKREDDKLKWQKQVKIEQQKTKQQRIADKNKTMLEMKKIQAQTDVKKTQAITQGNKQAAIDKDSQRKYLIQIQRIEDQRNLKIEQLKQENNPLNQVVKAIGTIAGGVGGLVAGVLAKKL